MVTRVGNSKKTRSRAAILPQSHLVSPCRRYLPTVVTYEMSEGRLRGPALRSTPWVVCPIQRLRRSGHMFGPQQW